MSCIYYPIWFKKNKTYALINLDNKVNVMILKYTSKLDLKICPTNVKVQKIDNFTLKIFGIVLANFSIKNKLDQT